MGDWLNSGPNLKRRRKYKTNHDQAHRTRAFLTGGWTNFRCDRCAKINSGLNGSLPTNWLRVPGEFDPKVRAPTKNIRIKGLVCDVCADGWDSRPVLVARRLLISLGSARRIWKDVYKSEYANLKKIETKRNFLATSSWVTLYGGIALFAFTSNVYFGLAAVFFILLRVLVSILNSRVLPKTAKLARESAETLFAKNATAHGQNVLRRTDFYSSADWRELRRSILDSQGRVCRNCGSTKRLSVDHIKPRSLFPELSIVPSNLQVLCVSCNSAKGIRVDIE